MGRDDLQPRELAEIGRLENGWNNGRRNILLTEGKEDARTCRIMQEQIMLHEWVIVSYAFDSCPSLPSFTHNVTPIPDAIHLQIMQTDQTIRADRDIDYIDAVVFIRRAVTEIVLPT